MARIYLAADYARRDEMLGCRTILEGIGHTITSRWIDNCDSIDGIDAGSKQTITGDRLPTYAKFADTDFEDICAAGTFILFTTGELTRGGRHTEFGIALALRKDLIIIGPREHVFHCSTWVAHYPSWRAFVIDFSRGWND